MRRLAVLALVSALVLLAAGCAGAGRHTSSAKPTAQGGSLATANHHASSGADPRWAEQCLPKGRQRLGAAPGYVGLTFDTAQRLTNSPVFAGGGRRCSTFRDDVYRTHPIAVVYNTWNPRASDARIIAAVRAVAGWQPGN
jgi:hypothetical protein